MAKMKSENSEDGEGCKKEEEEEPKEKSEAELEAAKVQKKFMEMMLSEEGSEKEKESHMMIIKGANSDDSAVTKEAGATKEATDSDFEKIIGQRMEVPVCNYGPDCRYETHLATCCCAYLGVDLVLAQVHTLRGA